jgi:hypothetical protein
MTNDRVQPVKFEVYDAAGRRMFHTEYESCLPKKEEILAMKAVGYKCYMDGRVYPPKRGNAK